MSAGLPADDLSALTRYQRLALIVGAAGVAVCFVCALVPAAPEDSPRTFSSFVYFFRAWLVAFNLFLGVALGGLVIVILEEDVVQQQELADPEDAEGGEVGAGDDERRIVPLLGDGDRDR